ncbi:MAG: hypothetical protein WCW30_00970 [Candidatus Gracilibacteria bacterium]
MKKILRILEHLFVLLVVFLFTASVVRTHREDATEQVTGYGAVSCVNPSVPEGFLYQNHKETIPDDYLLASDYQAIYRNGGMFDGDFYCLDSGESAEKVVYYNFNPGYGIDGGWSSRDAFVCGNQYLIVDAGDAFGEKVYGPFDLVPEVQGGLP